MRAFTIDRHKVTETIRVIRSGRGFVLPIGRHTEIPIGDRDDVDLVLDCSRGFCIHHCNILQMRSGGWLIVAPLPKVDPENTIEQQKAAYYRSDRSVLVHWITGDPQAEVIRSDSAETSDDEEALPRYFATKLASDSGEFFILFGPGQQIEIIIKGKTVRIGWTGDQFIYF